MPHKPLGRRQEASVVILTIGLYTDEALQEVLAETDPADCAGLAARLLSERLRPSDRAASSTA